MSNLSVESEVEKAGGSIALGTSACGAHQQRTVAIFADPLLAPTLTFIPAQGKMMKRFSPCYVGPQLGAADGLELLPERTAVISSRRTLLSRAREIPFRLVGRSPGFFRRVRRLRPVLIHAHFGPAAVEALPLARWLGVPLIANFHGGDATLEGKYLLQSEHYMLRRFWRRRGDLVHHARLLLACSAFIRSELIRKGFPESKILVHYIGIDTEFFAPDPAVPREQVVLYVGSLIPRKGLLLLIQAMAEVQKRVPNVELVVIGDGSMRAEAEATAGRVLRKCRFYGYRPASFVREWMNRAKVFSMPSYRTPDGNHEGFGLVFAEAQSMELPVVSFATGGIPEAVQDGSTGILCPEGDVGALARSLTLLLQDEPRRKTMSHAARRRVCREFDLRKCTNRLEGIYEDILFDGKKDAGADAGA
jgi:colanic acid/amylovoran biosynthesis glycosyltransferase